MTYALHSDLMNYLSCHGHECTYPLWELSTSCYTIFDYDKIRIYVDKDDGTVTRKAEFDVRNHDEILRFLNEFKVNEIITA